MKFRNIHLLDKDMFELRRVLFFIRRFLKEGANSFRQFA